MRSDACPDNLTPAGQSRRAVLPGAPPIGRPSQFHIRPAPTFAPCQLANSLLKESPTLAMASAGQYWRPTLRPVLGILALSSPTQAQLLVTSNPGCLVQLARGVRERGLAVRIMHLVELLDRSYAAAEDAPAPTS